MKPILPANMHMRPGEHPGAADHAKLQNQAQGIQPAEQTQAGATAMPPEIAKRIAQAQGGHPSHHPGGAPAEHPMMDYKAEDVHHSPFLIFYETTRACDLVCQHCRACAQSKAHANQLSTEASKAMIDELAKFPKKPLLVMTGGDPLKRPDIYELIRHGKSKGMRIAMTPSATPLVTAEAIGNLRDAGVSRMAISLDGADAKTHDAFRGIDGIFERSLRIIDDTHAAGLPMQINTTITKRNFHQVDAIAELINRPGVVLWSVFFLVPVGRGLREQGIEPGEYEKVFAKLWQHAQTKNYGVKTTEAHHYRRFVLQQKGDPQANPAALAGKPKVQRAPIGISDGKGVMFISHVGYMYPSGFLPINCGHFPDQSPVDVYQNHETFKSLRNPDGFTGKCSVCEYRKVCGGSRARAYAVTRNPLASEPDCVYIPKAWNHR
ncbi:MAG: TIGR04053 family radical SAM/SPASM domain-containing protein [Phycisphaeraceae bacterium JB051]